MRVEEHTTQGGMLDLGFDIARCYGCGWEGVPTFTRGKASTFCPVCERGLDDPTTVTCACGCGATSMTYTDDELVAVIDAERARMNRPKVGRNDPCPCGSGRKSKKCCYR